MVPPEHLRIAELQLRALCADNDLPQPDEIQYGDDCLFCLWHASELAVVVDCSVPPDELTAVEKPPLLN